MARLEAVWLFFVLSGFVLTKAATREGFSWAAYYPSRLVRLYGPVLVAILFAWLTYVIVPHVVHPGDSQILNGLPTGYSLPDILRDAPSWAVRAIRSASSGPSSGRWSSL